MLLSLSQFVVRHRLAVIAAWLLLVILLWWLTPAWDSVTRDGDLAYLPPRMPSVVGEQLLSSGFPYNRPKSQVAFVLARDDAPLDKDDLAVAYDLARRVKNLHGVVAFTRGRQLAEQALQLASQGSNDEAAAFRRRAHEELVKAQSALDEAIRFDGQLADYAGKRRQESPAKPPGPPAGRLAAAYFNRALLAEYLGRPDDATADREVARALEPALAEHPPTPIPEEAASLPVLDVWTWMDDVFGKKLGTRQARLILVQLSNEFMAVDNIRILDYLEDLLQGVRATLTTEQHGKLQLGFSGSAAVGGDMLRAAKESLRNTELTTVLLVVVILGLVYRSPLLVVLPLVTIFVSLVSATSLVASLASVGHWPGYEWWTYKVFTTTKVFIIVILYGAGTDYFLFLVARYKEELQQGWGVPEAVQRALVGVGDALLASALTTILGLATMFFAGFGKFSNSGPTIALCLTVTLLACLTLAPALLAALGTAVFWPFHFARRPGPDDQRSPATLQAPESRLWPIVADQIVRRPGLILITSLLLLWPLAQHGVLHGSDVTYDFLRQLPPERASRQGAELMARHFPIGDSGPIIVVAHQPDGGFDAREGRERIRELTSKLYLDGVDSVRSITDPLGDFPPGAKVGLFRTQSWTKLVASPHPRSQEVFVATTGQLAGQVTRLDVVLKADPFSAEAIETLTRIEGLLQAERDSPDSPWHGTEFAFAGTTAGIRDLELVTQADNLRIQILVVLAVLAVLLVILRRPLICLYLIATVLFSYYVTMGATQWFFAWVDGPEFRGLDWKVPLFLFVILVAVGEDYNVYLVTRVFEEQRRRGLIEGLREAVIRTGGIITSCGLIMAGTFISMTSGIWTRFLPAWLPWAERIFGKADTALAAVVQLGFALSLGVLLDTLVVRPVLVPAFLALLYRWEQRRDLGVQPQAVADPD